MSSITIQVLFKLFFKIWPAFKLKGEKKRFFPDILVKVKAKK
jgi:hypothetical protein